MRADIETGSYFISRFPRLPAASLTCRKGFALLVQGVLQVLLQPLCLRADAHLLVGLQLGAAEGGVRDTEASAGRLTQAWGRY